MNDRKSETENKYQQYLDDTDDGRQSTHYQDCWHAHTRCAIAEAAAAHEQIAKVRAETIEEASKTCEDWAEGRSIGTRRDMAAAEMLRDLAASIRALQEKAK